jgi:hypothetical protein
VQESSTNEENAAAQNMNYNVSGIAVRWHLEVETSNLK